MIDKKKVYKLVLRLDPSLSDFIAYINSIKPLKGEEYHTLIKRVEAGDESAKSQMIEYYLWLSVLIGYFRSKKYGIDISESISDSYMALIYGVENYKSNEYVTPYMFLRDYIYRWLCRNQKIGQNIIDYKCLSKIEGAELVTILRNTGYYDNTDGDNTDTIDYIFDNRDRMQNKYIDAYTAVSFLGSNPMEIEERLTDYYHNNDIRFTELLYNGFMTVEEQAEYDILKEELDNLLSTLTEREQKWLRCRYGLDDGIFKSLSETGKEYGYSKERIRQVEEKALRKMRHPSRSRHIRDFCDMD